MDSPTPTIALTNADKVLYPATGTRKGDVFDYYTTIADIMLPHIAGRPVTRKRWPNGVEQSAFFEKQLASSAPRWLSRGTVTHRSGTTTYPVIDRPSGLAWIGQQAALEVHVPQWRFIDARPGPATRLVFDLDPGDDVTMQQLSGVARAVRDLMDDVGLTTFPVTSGSKGLHLYARFPTPISSDGAVLLAKRVAQQLEHTFPELVTATMTKALRTGRVFVDWSQNSASKTTVAPYSLRGRAEPTVAAPRTWEELDDPGLSQLRLDEVLRRVERDGDLIAGLDDPVQVPGRLSVYRGMRDSRKTPEPVPQAEPAEPVEHTVGQDNTFVIQEHHARRLHYDFRLERNGVLVSWAVPKNLPETTSVNHLAVHTEDHPLQYAKFEGAIPKGEYGGGIVTIWDSGTYETEKFHDLGENGEVIVTLHGKRVSGRYALIQTDGKNWLAHRTKDQAGPAPQVRGPMLATAGPVGKLDASHWAFEGKWDGYRLLVDARHGELTLRSRSGRDVTSEYAQLKAVAADLADHHVLLDGEVVALDASGVPSFGEMQNRARASRVEFWAFDLLHLDGRSLLNVTFRDRRRLLEALAGASNLVVPEQITGDGEAALEYSQRRRWEGVVAKKWDSTYQPGRRSASWVKEKNWKTQEFVIGGWREGDGGRSGGVGALLMGIPGEGGLDFVGRVGTGFTDKELAMLKRTLAPLHTEHSPFNVALRGADAKRVTFVRPMLVGEVRHGEWTSDGRLRHPSWRGLRPDRSPESVVRDHGAPHGKR
jgi:DNA ligase D-like protein (predicted ligase)/DNA ligase D-like protein (predicted polymerase)/DNA ligase D-like protein (predicted 3'-phosphoesterase)